MSSTFFGYEKLSRSRRVLSISALGLGGYNTMLDLLNSSYPTQPYHSLIANYN